MTRSPPGEVLLEEYLIPMGISQNATACAIGEIIHARRSITPAMSIRFGVFFGQSAEFWHGIEVECDFLAPAKDPHKLSRPHSARHDHRPRILKCHERHHDSHPPHRPLKNFRVNAILWNKLIVCGHSQGAGMAAMLAKTRVTDRCVMFTDMDWWVAGNRFYNWISATTQTTVDRWCFLAHERDQPLGFTAMQACAVALDVSRYGASVKAESSTSASFGGRHFLSTNLEPAPAQSASYHGCPIVDAATPRQADGVTPVFKTLWDYLLLHDTVPVTIESTSSTSISVIFSSGTLEQSDDLAL